jgi:flagellar basal body-associated protein FliL/succinate dehydrogenase flavin-adding protein (antitoxin of CptAB toxin-antitoxin module)
MEQRTDKRNSSRNILLVALLALAALNVLLLYFWFKEKENNKTKEATIAAKTEEVLVTKMKLDSISAQLDAKIAEIQQLGGSVDSLLKVKEQLEADKVKIREGNNFNAREYQQKINQYQNLLAQKDQEIARLRQENGMLTEENQTLTSQNSSLRQDRQVLIDTVSSYATKTRAVQAQNRELADKVTVAAALHADDIAVTSLDEKGREKDGGTYKAKRLDKIKVNFRLSQNPLTEKNAKDIYLRILDPTGAVIADMATGSGEFTYANKEMIYTAMQRIDYDNSGQQLSFVYGRGGQRFNEGRHIVEIYSEGFRIGQGEFTVK